MIMSLARQSDLVADAVMALALMLTRGKGAAARMTSLRGKTLGLVGFGTELRAVAGIAHRGFGMRVLAHSPIPTDQHIATFGIEQVACVDMLLQQADVISLHCSGDGSSRHLINARRLNLMRPDALLINTSDAALVDEQALLHALWFETIGGAGFDLALSEPCCSTELEACDNAILLPDPGHVAASLPEAASTVFADNIVPFLEAAQRSSGRV